MNRISWQAPARYEAHNEGCDCYWHNRVFTHIGIGPSCSADRRRLELERSVSVKQYDDGRNSRCMTIVLDGAKIEVVRSVNPRTPGCVWFGAWYGDPRDPNKTVRLQPHNDHRRRAPDGGDPTLIWNMYPALGWPLGSELVIWREAWWWHLIDGQDPLALDVADPPGNDEMCG